MTDMQQTDALREALQFLIRADIPADPKRLLIETIMQALATAESAISKQDAIKKSFRDWQPNEIELATQLLQGKVAGSWQAADEIVTRLSRELRRDASDIRAKAIELGFDVAIDYHLARARATPAAE